MASRLILLLAFGLTMGCVQKMDETVREAMMDEALASRMDRFRQQQYADCRDAVLSEALWTVDSLFRENPIVIKLDTIERPPVPDKPLKPVLVTPAGTQSLEPLLKVDTVSGLDTLN